MMADKRHTCSKSTPRQAHENDAVQQVPEATQSAVEAANTQQMECAQTIEMTAAKLQEQMEVLASMVLRPMTGPAEGVSGGAVMRRGVPDLMSRANTPEVGLVRTETQGLGTRQEGDVQEYMQSPSLEDEDRCAMLQQRAVEVTWHAQETEQEHVQHCSKVKDYVRQQGFKTEEENNAVYDTWEAAEQKILLMKQAQVCQKSEEKAYYECMKKETSLAEVTGLTGQAERSKASADRGTGVTMTGTKKTAHVRKPYGGPPTMAGMTVHPRWVAGTLTHTGYTFPGLADQHQSSIKALEACYNKETQAIRHVISEWQDPFCAADRAQLQAEHRQ